MMKAMLLDAPRQALRLAEIPEPKPEHDQVLVRVRACGVCRTDLHVLDGDLHDPKLPLVLGHEIIGTVEGVGDWADRFSIGERVGIPWLGETDGTCVYCRSGRENLCDRARFTGYHFDGGYAALTLAHQDFCFRVPAGMGDVEAAPLMCAGLIGYRCLSVTGDAQRLGIYGFGAAAHIITQVAKQQGRRVFAFTRPGDVEGQAFAREMGALWAGDSSTRAPDELDAAIIFAPAGELVPVALRAVAKGGIVVCGGIHMSDIPSFPYDLLWGERQLRSVANLTRKDAQGFLALASTMRLAMHTKRYELERANDALADLRRGRVRGAAVLDLNAD